MRWKTKARIKGWASVTLSWYSIILLCDLRHWCKGVRSWAAICYRCQHLWRSGAHSRTHHFRSAVNSVLIIVINASGAGEETHELEFWPMKSCRIRCNASSYPQGCLKEVRCWGTTDWAKYWVRWIYKEDLEPSHCYSHIKEPQVNRQNHHKAYH